MNNPEQGLNALEAQHWLLRWPHFFSAEECQLLLALMARTEPLPPVMRAILTLVDTSLRKLQDVPMPPEVHHLIGQKLADVSAGLCQHFRLSGPLQWEPLQFLCYRSGDYFRPHADTIADRPRALSVVLYLNDSDTYQGGQLRFHPPGENPVALAPSAGMLLAFRPELVHEVTPLQSGKRYSIATWAANRVSGSL
jgi:SM-20-related protein